MIKKLYELVEEIGAIPLILDANEHDDITAAISHVPHIIAAGLVNMVKNSDDSKDEKMRTLAAGGFKDITRIASSSAVMWQNICLTNTASIQNFLGRYISILEEFNSSLTWKDEDYLYQFFDGAGEYRNSIPNKSGMMQKVHEIYLDIIDEAGAIATIATLLATNSISIKNIGIIHNREFQEGVLRIEFYDESAAAKAVDLLKKYSYTVYERT
jgi:prephenate dehydrogenase